MTQVKISQLPPLTAPARNDLIPLVDTSANTTKYIQMMYALTGATRIVAPVGYTGFADYYTTGTADDVDIQVALNLSTGGSTYIHAGVYDITNTITLPSNIILFGEGDSTILKANASLSGTKTLIINSDVNGGNTNIIIKYLAIDGNQTNRSGKVIQDTAGHSLILRNVTNSTISNVSSYNGIVSGICLGYSSQNCIVENSKVYNCWDHNLLLLGKSDGTAPVTKNFIRNNLSYGAGQGAGQGVGIEIASYATYNTIIGNVSRNNLEGGIHFYNNSSHNTASNNILTTNGVNGIALVDASDFNIISSNIIDASGNCGINATTFLLTYGTKHSTIFGNEITNCVANGIRGNSSTDFSDCLIENNFVYNCGATAASGNLQNGMYFLSPARLTIQGNRFDTSGLSGLRIDSPARVTVNGNFFESNPSRGIDFETSSAISDCTISNNLFDDNTGQAILLATKATRCVISGNVIKSSHGNNSGIDLRGVSYCTITGNSCVANSKYGIWLTNDASSVGSTYNIVSNNTCTLNTSGGIAEDGAADYNIYIGNNTNGNTASNFATVGANDVIANNITT